MRPLPDLARIWPPAGLRIRAGDLELRWIDDDLAVQLGDLAGRGVHAPDEMPFLVPWTRGSARDVARSVATYQWRARSQVGADGPIVLEFAVLLKGQPVGVQGASGDDWRVRRSLETGSWLGRDFHGRGIGTRMRVALLAGLFEGLGAERVTSSAFADNPASRAVSRRAGYIENGEDIVDRDGVPTISQRFALSRSRWEALRQDHDVILGTRPQLIGFEAVREMLGESRSDPPRSS